MGIVVVGDVRHFPPHAASVDQQRETQGLDSALVKQRFREMQRSTPVEPDSEKQHPAIEVVQLLERSAPTFRERQRMLVGDGRCGDTASAHGLHRMVAPQRTRPRTEGLANRASDSRRCPGIEDREMFPCLSQPSLRHTWAGPRRRIGAMRRRGRHHQSARVAEHAQERTHHGGSAADYPADRAQGGMDQQGHPGHDADARKVTSETGFRLGPSLEIPCSHADSVVTCLTKDRVPERTSIRRGFAQAR